MKIDVSASVADRADRAFDATVNQLIGYLRHPAISCETEHAGDVAKLADKISNDLRTLGLQSEVLHVAGALPCVAANWLQAGADKPTVLIYGHLDLQPVQGENWHTPPHEATIRGDRLYARGAADDMGGWVSHLAAVAAWLGETDELPCNIRLIIEGEEEIGSPNLERYMDAFPEAFQADAMVLTDCENPSTDVPGLTVSLRGICEFVVTVSALDADGHSGLWGNMVPDVSTALMQLISRLIDRDGRPTLGLRQTPQKLRDAAAAVPIPPEVIRRGAHLRHGVEPLPPRDKPAAEWMWLQPAITVVATTYPPRERKKNALRSQVQAVLSVRTAPGQTAAEMFDLINAELTRDVPQGVLVEVVQERGAGEGWLYEPKGPAFVAADNAYERAWGHKLVRVGVGGSIPFVALFGRRFGSLPLILNGVMDPETTAHGPNESLHLGVFRRAIAANVYLYHELAQPGVLRQG